MVNGQVPAVDFNTIISELMVYVEDMQKYSLRKQLSFDSCIEMHLLCQNRR